MSDQNDADDSEPERPDDGTDGVKVRVVDRRWWAQETAETDAEPRSNKPTYVEDLERQLAEKDGLVTSYAAKYKEAAAEFEEARLRLRREISKDIEREKRRVLATFLDIVDNLDRALEAAGEGADSSAGALVKGVEMVRRQVLGTLEGHGVTPIDAAGEAFDPTQHDAISTIAVEDPQQQDVVVEVVKLGYRIGEDVLRPSGVVVGKHGSIDEGTD